jgi:hypothetical protein
MQQVLVTVTPEQIALTAYVIYDRPKDYPDSFPVRRHFTLFDGRIIAERDLFGCGDTVDDARRCLPPGLYKMPQLAGDDPAILEVWI